MNSKEEAKFTKQNLKSGMIVTTRDGREYFVILGHYLGDIIVNGISHNWESLIEYKDDLTCVYSDTQDIVKVEKPSSCFTSQDFEFERKLRKTLWERRNTLWERKEETEMTIAELEQKLGIKNLRIKK